MLARQDEFQVTEGEKTELEKTAEATLPHLRGIELLMKAMATATRNGLPDVSYEKALTSSIGATLPRTAPPPASLQIDFQCSFCRCLGTENATRPEYSEAPL